MTVSYNHRLLLKIKLERFNFLAVVIGTDDEEGTVESDKATENESSLLIAGTQFGPQKIISSMPVRRSGPEGLLTLREQDKRGHQEKDQKL